jgi:hypothetical protein
MMNTERKSLTIILGKVVSVASAACLRMTSSSLIGSDTLLLRATRLTEDKAWLFPSSLPSFSHTLSATLKVQNMMSAPSWTRMPTGVARCAAQKLYLGT